MAYFINSTDNIGISSGNEIKFSDLRTWFSKTGSVSLGSLGGGDDAVPSSIPTSGNQNALSSYYDVKRRLEKDSMVTLSTSGNIYPASNIEQYNIYVVGGGGSGGAGKGDGGREAVGSGGGAGGCAYKSYTRAEAFNGSNASTITVGAGGDASTVAAQGGISGEDGGQSRFAPSGTGTDVYAHGGLRGFGSRQGADAGDIDLYYNATAANPTNPTEASGSAVPVGNNSTAASTPSGYNSWGGCSRSEGGAGAGIGAIPEDHPAFGSVSLALYAGGQANGYNAGSSGQANRGHTGRDAKGSTAGGNVSFGWDYDTDGTTFGRNGGYYLNNATGGASSPAAAPTKPAEFEGAVTHTFQGGQGYSFGNASNASDYGAGGGGAASSANCTSGAGADGCVILVLYKVAGT